MKSGHAVHRDLAWALKQQATRAGERTPSVRGADWRLATVTAVPGDGTVTADGIPCRCLNTYAAPAVGDVAVISQSSSGNWIAIGRLASSGTPLYTPIYRYKTANLDRFSNTLTDDPDLTIALDASAVYKVEMHLHYAATDAIRFRTAWTVPTGATGNRSAVGPDQGQILSGTSSGGTGRWGVQAFSTACIYGNRDSSVLQCFAMEEAIVTTTTAGTCALQWAQSTTSASIATRLAAGSSMRVTRLA
ncbi:hypothetical protein ACIGXF_16470 [Streptomyces sp. NPDC053086]|uniref:hypothetical protein n=1 Tax=unclassified Streptomyces TaxID=2593676 RepID=UPI0037CD7355